ncbi:hypothetical protein C0J52_27345, partial [Blattella germanica]
HLTFAWPPPIFEVAFERGRRRRRSLLQGEQAQKPGNMIKALAIGTNTGQTKETRISSRFEGLSRQLQMATKSARQTLSINSSNVYVYAHGFIFTFIALTDNILYLPYLLLLKDVYNRNPIKIWASYQSCNYNISLTTPLYNLTSAAKKIVLHAVEAERFNATNLNYR